MQQGKHTDYEKSLHDELLASANAESQDSGIHELVTITIIKPFITDLTLLLIKISAFNKQRHRLFYYNEGFVSKVS